MATNTTTTTTTTATAAAAPAATTTTTTTIPMPAPRFPRISGSGERSSRFIEPPMQEYTPANSLYDEDMTDEVDATKTRVFLRALNAILHLVACVLLLAIMALFLSRTRGTYTKHVTPEAVALTVLLSLDACIDLLSLVRVRSHRPGWAVLVRLLLGVGYLAVFMVYVGFGRVFPMAYTYWGMSSGFAGPVVYLFLWLIGVWNLLNTALHRHKFGHDMREYGQAVRNLSLRRRQQQQRRGQQQQHPAGSAAPRPGSQPRVARGVGGVGVNHNANGSPRFWDRRRRDVEATADARNNPTDIPLAERNSEPKAESVTPSSTASSSAKADEATVEAAGPRAPSTS